MGSTLVSHPGHILPMGYSDLQADDAPDAKNVGRYAKGQLGFVRDDFGLRIFRYLHNKLTVASKAGGLYSRAANISFTVLAASTRTALVAGAGTFGVVASGGDQAGRVVYYQTNSVTGGAAPEGETALVVNNTATQLNLDTSYALSAAPNANDTAVVYSLYDFIAAAAGPDLAVNVFGLCVATNGIGSNNWGVIQMYGYCPNVLTKSNVTFTANAPVVADVEQVGPLGALATRFWIGFSPLTINNPNRGFSLIFINVESPVQPAATA